MSSPYTAGTVRVTVVIPVHNEAAYLPKAMADLFAELETIPAQVRVLLVENGSTDGTAAVAAAMASDRADLDVIINPRADYGAALRAGFLAAEGDWIVNFDIDYFSGAFLAAALQSEADIVIASKRTAGSDDRRSLLRRIGTWGFNRLLRMLFGSRVSDTHGMKAFRGSLVGEIAPNVVSTRDLFDTELVLRAERRGARILEVPVVVEELRPARSSFLRRVPRTLVGLFQLRRLLAREARKTTSR